MRLQYLSLCLCAGLYLPCLAQYQENLPQAKPIPPNAAAMFKVLERPLGTFTGTIPIGFPLCGVTSGSLSANVSLSYNSTGGIKVEELSGCVGLGFSLSDGGGRITQMVRHKPDDEEYYGRLNNSVAKPSTFNCSNNDHLYELHEDHIDLEPDVFMYSFNGRSGKFFLKENGDVVMMTNDGIKITYETDSEGISSWTIKDESGNTFQFASKITNNSSYSSTNGSTNPTVSSRSWFLDAVTDMNGENTISYTYTDGGGNTFTTISGSYWPLSLAATLDCQGFNTMGDIGTVTTEGGEYLISRIDGSDGYILFNNVMDYVYGSKKITSIELHDPAGNLIKKYKFNYGTSFSSNRWRLNNFSEFGSSGTDSLTTEFEYEEFYNLPAVLSTGVDIWGYFNGAGNDYTAMIPNIIASYGFIDVYWDYRAWRNSGGNVASANILKKIIYPTGGYREITYEGNRVLGLGDFFMYHPDPEYMATRTFTETGFTYTSSSQPCMQHLFTVNSFYGQSKFTYELHNIGFSCSNNYTVKIMRLLDSTDLIGGSVVYSFYGANSGSWALENGYYRVDVFAASSSCTIDNIAGSWPEGTYADTAIITQPYGISANLYKRAYNGGGVRVKEVKDFDPVANKFYKTEYRYKMYSRDSTITSGMLASPMNVTATENSWDCGCQYVKVYPGSSYPLATEGGAYVVYPEVRTIDSANGYTDRFYSYTYDVAPTSFPLEPPVDYSYFRGNLVHENVFDKNGSILKETANEWGWNLPPPSTPGKRVKSYWYVTIGGGPGIPSISYWTEARPSIGNYNDMYMDGIADMTAYTDYSLSQPPKVLSQSIEYIHGPSGYQTIKTDYDFYEQNGTFFIKKKKVTLNGGQTKEQTFKYAFNSNSDFKLGLTSGEQTMKTTLLNVHYLQPLEVVDTIKTNGSSATFLSGSKYIFNAYGYYGARLAKFRSFATATDSTEINFTSYDSSGNLQEQYKTNDQKAVCLWGYNRTYPVVKIVGSNVSTVLGFVNMSVINNPSSDAALRTELNKIRTGLSGSPVQVITYTYSPLHGMTSMTDANGRTVYYEYDLFGRLKLIRDPDNRIVKKIEFKLNNPE
jgi:YD repeat-containing protein